MVLTLFSVAAQQKILKGQLIANDDVEGLHILNKTAVKYTISDENGGFNMPAEVLDRLYVSGVKYQPQEIVITADMMAKGELSIKLVENINVLNEVVVGKILTGSLESDIENSDAKPEINFYDLGIPGNTNLPLTQSEQRLHDADHGQFVYYYGIGLAINVHKILNRVNGDTKEYKARVKTEFNEKCVNRLKDNYANTIFEAIEIPKKHQAEFFQFCLEDENFNAICADDNELNDVSFLLEKLSRFKNQLDEGK